MAGEGVRALASNEPIGAQCPDGGARIDAGIDRNGSGALDADEIASTQYVCHGTTGKNALVKMTAEAAGSHCVSGGTRVEAGADTNASGVLDTAEVTSVAYVCDGAAGAAGNTGSTGANGLDTLMTVVTESANVHCATGDSLIQSGRDANRNGVLDAPEVTATTRVCNGSNGAAGAAGANGSNGANGIHSLIANVAEAAGVNCTAGGRRVTTGADTNVNGVLDAPEVTSTAYLCNGVAGTNGSAGSNGAVGLTMLAVYGTEPAGANCAIGGMKIETGLDTDRDAHLGALEITATSYACNSQFGIGWEEVASTSKQAVSNRGYVANNAARVAITLPSAPAFGDVVRVSGAGAGGWSIRQGTGQSVVTSNFDVLPTFVPAAWTRSVTVSAQNWRSAALSADGRRQAAVSAQGYIFTSADSGATWAQGADGPRNYTGVASSSDGRRILATAYNNMPFLSIDYGATWTQVGDQGPWLAAASSGDGRVLAVAGQGRHLQVSTDYGINWSDRNVSSSYTSVVVSADGAVMLAVDANSDVHRSTDEGTNWVVVHSDTVAWTGASLSADGQHALIFAGAPDRTLMRSNDAGLSWQGVNVNEEWTGVAVSGDGRRMVAVSVDQQTGNEGLIYTSTDFGLHWTPSPTLDGWSAVGLSADGTRGLALASQGTQGLYTSALARPPSTSVGAGGRIDGSQHEAIELQYIGNGKFIVLSATGSNFAVY